MITDICRFPPSPCKSWTWSKMSAYDCNKIGSAISELIYLHSTMLTRQNIGENTSLDVLSIRCKHGNDRISRLQTSNIQVATILRIKGWISFWTHLKYEHWGRNLSSMVNKLCSTLSSHRRFGSGRALIMVSISRQSSSMIVTVRFDLK